MSLCQRLTAFVALALFLSPVAQAAPPDAKHLAADAKWYVHLDFDAAKQTTLYAQALELARGQFPLDDVVAQLKQFMGVNPLTDITGVTVYNNSFEKDVAALLIYAKVDRGLLIQALAQNPDFQEQAYGRHTLNSWTDKGEAKTKHGAFFGDGLIVMSDHVDTLKLALDVLDGTKPAGSPLVKEPPKGVFLSVSADLAKAGDKNVSKLLSATEPAFASVGESDGNLIVDVNLAAKAAEQALQIKSMLDGVKAFGQIGAGDLPTAKALIDKVTVTADGAKVAARFTHDAGTVLQTLKKLDEENKAKKKGNGL